MCGITGFYLPRSDSGNKLHQLTRGGLLSHRGPDDFNVWIDPTERVGLQHYRLSIVDLSPTGRQPMSSVCGRYVAVFNGEIYNHLELRDLLTIDNPVFVWRGHSDTETLLAAFSTWGIKKSLSMVVGMFAIALYDNKEKSLTLIRDRLGEKPLYYGLLHGGLAFASEPKVFKRIGCNLSVNRSALSSYLRLGYVPGSQSIFENLLRLPPGHTLCLTVENILQNQLPQPSPYWQLSDAVHTNIAPTERAKGSVPNDADVDQLDQLMLQSVRGQMVADVPLGALLSGGIDSTLVVSMMQRQSAAPIKTYSIGFHDGLKDEAPHARQIAKYLQTEHTEFYLSSQSALDLIPSLSKVYCEPFSDSSQVPTLLVSQMARRGVKVALTGDGGDELFAGYDRYWRLERGMKLINGLPVSVRKVLGSALDSIPSNVVNFVVNNTRGLDGIDNPSDRLKKIVKVLDCVDISELNRRLITLWDPSELMTDATESRCIYTSQLPNAPTSIERVMLADLLCYLPDDLLVKVDRASMSVGLECRAPFLDHRVVEHAVSLGLMVRTANGHPKGMLKALLRRYVPDQLWDRPKQGFGIPINQWLRGPLRDWASDLIASATANKLLDLNWELINSRWQEHLSNKREWAHCLWVILMLLSWLDESS